MIFKNIFLIGTIVHLVVLSQIQKSLAQISSSSSSETVVRSNLNSNSNVFSVNNGKQVGGNLFHTFNSFNLRRKQQVVFNNSTGTTNIFGFISGSNSSFIDGSISANGSSNLFLINPKGIVFGNNVSIDIGGSFLASTAGSIEFSNGKEISINESIDRSLQMDLGSEVPSLLKINSRSGSISLGGVGHRLDQQDFDIGLISAELRDVGPETGLQVSQGNSISFVASRILSEGGVLTAPSGNINILSLQRGAVPISPLISNTLSPVVSSKDKSIFADVTLDQLTLLNTSGPTEGRIFIASDNLDITEGSFLLSTTQNGRDGGEITIEATGDFLVQGTLNNQNFPGNISPIRTFSGISTDVLKGAGTNINIKADNLTLAEGGVFNLFTRGSSIGGEIDIDILGDIEIVGESRFLPVFGNSNISTSSFDRSIGSRIEIDAENLYLRRHGEIRSISLSENRSQPINIDVDDSIRLEGISELSSLSSALISWSIASGEAAAVNVQSKKLTVLDGSLVGSSAFESGMGGDVNIDVENQVFISGYRADPFGGPDVLSSIESTASASLFFQETFDLPSTPSGDSGDLNINANAISLSNSGVITALNDGSGLTGNVNIKSNSLVSNSGIISSSGFEGSGGNLSINVSRLELDSNSQINASTVSGDGGNIFIDSFFVSLNDESQIQSSALGNGPGGNIDITTDLITLSDSSILANAQQGTGGQIFIEAQGIFPDSQSIIAADSNFGVDGIVQLESFDNSLETNLKREPKALTTTVDLTCSPSPGNKTAVFTIPGSGGIPKQPATYLGQVPLTVAREPSRKITISAPTFLDPNTGKDVPIIEAQGFVTESDGTIGFSVRASNPEGDESRLLSSSCLRKALKS